MLTFRIGPLVAGSVLLSLVLSTHSNAQWTQLSGWDGNNNVSTFAVIGTDLFAGTFGSGVFLSTDDGVSWTPVNSGLADTVVVWALAANGTNLFAGGYGGVFRTTNNGASWVVANKGLKSNYVYALALSGTSLLAGTYDGIFLSPDSGASWSPIDSGLTRTNVLALVVSGKKIFAGTWYGGAFVSTNNGTSWTAVGLPNLYIRTIVASGTNLFAGADSGGVFRSTNDGMTWATVNSGLPKYSGDSSNYPWEVWSLAVSGADLFVGMDDGEVLVSRNNGTNWKSVSSGLPTGKHYLPIIALSGANLFTGSIFFGNHTCSLWRRPLSEMVTGISADLTVIPYSFVLLQNYPNPFNPSTTIRYALPQRSHVTLVVFNTLGQQVAVLVNDTQEAGYHTVRFEGEGLASGMYFYRIQAGTFVQTMKLLLLR